MYSKDVVSAFVRGAALPDRPESDEFLLRIADAARAAWSGLRLEPMFTFRFAGRVWLCRGNAALGLLRIVGDPGGGCLLTVPESATRSRPFALLGGC